MSGESLSARLTATATLAAIRSAVLPELPQLRVEFSDFADRPPASDGGPRHGEYDPGSATIYIKSGLPDAEVQRVTRHEIGHAAVAEAAAARRLPLLLRVGREQAFREVGAWDEALASRFERLERSAIAEVRDLLRRHPPATKQVDPGWLGRQRQTACDFTADVLAEPGVSLSPEARAQRDRIARICAATDAAHRSTDPDVAALSSRMAGYDAAHRTSAKVRADARRLTPTQLGVLSARRKHARAAARELGLSDAAVRSWAVGCRFERLLPA